MTPLPHSDLHLHELVRSFHWSSRGFDLPAWSAGVLGLLAKGADPLQLDKHDVPALGYLTADTCGMNNEQEALVKTTILEMIKKGANPLVYIDYLNGSVLAYHLRLATASTNHLDVVFALLWCINEFEQQGELLRDEFGNTALASLFAKPSIVQSAAWPMKLKWIARDSAHQLDGKTPQQWLSSSNTCGQALLHNMYEWRLSRPEFLPVQAADFYRTVAILVNRGSRLDAKDNRGVFVFEYVIECAKREGSMGGDFKVIAHATDERDFVLSSAYDLAASSLESVTGRLRVGATNRL